MNSYGSVGFTATPEQPVCVGTATGKITVNGLTGASPFAVGITPPVGATYTVSNVSNTYTINNAAAGVYTITLKDALGCTLQKVVTLTEMPDLRTIELNPDGNASCNARTVKIEMPLAMYNTYTSRGYTIRYSINGGTWTNLTAASTVITNPAFIPGKTVSITYATVLGTVTNCITQSRDYVVPNTLGGVSVTTNLSSFTNGCSGSPSGFTATVTVPAVSGIQYQFSLNNEQWTASQTSGVYVWNNLTPGRTYKFYVRNSQGCVAEVEKDIYSDPGVDLPVKVTLTPTPACGESSTAKGSLSLKIERRTGYSATTAQWRLYKLDQPFPLGVPERPGTGVGAPTPITLGATPIIITIPNVDPNETYYVEVTEGTCKWGSRDAEVKKQQPITVTVTSTGAISCDVAGVVEVTARGGSGVYTYTLESITPGVSFTSPIAVANNRIQIFRDNIVGAPLPVYPSAAVTLTISATVTDVYGCSSGVFTTTLMVQPKPKVYNTVVTGCANGQFTLTVMPIARTAVANAPAAELPNYEYSRDGGYSYQSSNVFGGLVAGTYPVVIREISTGCTATETVVIADPLEANVVVSKPFNCNTAAGEFTIKVDKGSGVLSKYKYTIKNPANITVVPPTTFTASETTVAINKAWGTGTYTIEVTDVGQTAACQTTSMTVVMKEPEAPSIEVTTVSITCHGAGDGKIIIEEKNAASTSDFTYVVTPPTGVSTPSVSAITKTASITVQGVYTITVTSAVNSCTAVYTVTVGEPTAITVSNTLIRVKQFSCSTDNNGEAASIEFLPGAISGGTGSYTISYAAPDGSTGTGNKYVFNNANGGVISITISDNSGCYTTVTRTIAPFERLDASVITITTGPLTCTTPATLSFNVLPGSNITLSKLRYAAGAVPPTGHPSTWGVAPVTVAVATTTTIWIGHIDTGCMIKYPFTAPDPNNFSINAPQITNVSCKGTTTGKADFTLSNVGTAGYAVGITPAVPTSPSVLAPGVTNFTITGLASATYTLTLRDNATNCEQTYNFSIAEPAVALTATTSVRSITCNPGNNGEITIENATGGWGVYEYYVDTAVATPSSAVWTSTNVFSGLSAGSYHIAIRDKERCQVDLAPITLTNPTAITGVLTITQENCTPGIGEVEVRSVTGGAGTGYTYQLVKDGAAIGTAQATTLFTNLSSGTYEVVVTDIWGCTATLTSVRLYEPIAGVGADVQKEITCSIPQGATISVTHQGGDSGTISYTLTLQGGTSITNNTGVFTNVTTAGAYTIEVKDRATGCATQTYALTLTDAAVVTFTYTSTNVSCKGGNNGTLKVSIPGTQMQTDYRIRIAGPTGFATRSETVNTTPKDFPFEGLIAGVYTITVSSSRDCVATGTVTITEPDALVVSTTTVTTHFKCNTANEAQQAIVQVVAAGGTAPYSYNFVLFDGQSTSTTNFGDSTLVGVFSVTSNGTYTQTVMAYIKDANGCETNTLTPIVIPPLQRITAVNIDRISYISCAGPETATITIVGGSNKGYTINVTGKVATPSTQTLTAGVNVTTINFTEPGQYELTVTDSDTGCYFSTTYSVTEYDTIDVSARQTKPVTCKTGNDGEITLTVSHYTGGFTYRVVNASNTAVEVKSPTTVAGSTGVNNIVINGLGEGKYLVELVETQHPYCTKTTTVVNVSGPADALTATTTIANLIKCGTGQVGSFSVEAAGGWGSYQYRLLQGATPHAVYGTYSNTSLFEGLTAATYAVEVKDAQGCVVTVTQVMAPPAPLNATVTATNVKCYGYRGGEITVSNTTGGSGNYTYELWEIGGAQVRGAQTETTFSGLDAREYRLKIVDGWNCDIEIPIEVTEPDELRVTASIVSPRTCMNNATISVTVTGGVPPYQYRKSTDTGWQSANTFLLGDGTYEFYVKDAEDCESKVSNKVEVVRPEALVLHFNTQDAIVRCNGEATGRITFSATGGMGGNQYTLHKDNPANPALTVSATQVNATEWAFMGLRAGKYYVKAISNDCGYTSPEIEVTERPAFTVISETRNISCFGQRDGVISITVTEGTGKKMYAISPRLDRFVDTGFFNNLGRGQYTVRAQDEYGCYTDTVFDITEPDLLKGVIDKQTNEICAGANDGTVSITITGGTQSYSTSIDGGNTWNAGKTLYTDLAPGNYLIMVRDARSCTTEVSVAIAAGVDLQETATVAYSCENNSVSNVIKASVAAQYLANTTFALDGATAQATGYFAGVTAGVHTITVRHLNGCTKTVTVVVQHFDPLTVTSTKTDITCYAKTDGKINLAVSGATGSYTYSISPQEGAFDEATREFTGLPKGQYTIRVAAVGSPACEVLQTISILEPEVLKAVAETVTETCYRQNDGQMRFVIEGGRAPYSYELKKPDGSTYATASNIAVGEIRSYTGLEAGRYKLEFSDGNCTETLEIEVAAAPSIAPVSVTPGFNCSTESTTYTTSYLTVVFPESARGKLSSTTTSYSLDGGITIRPFVSFDGAVGKTTNIEDGVYSLTIHYKGEGMSNVCQEVWSETVSVTRYPGMEILDKSDPRAINKIKVQVVGGKPFEGDVPYSVTFNGVFDGTYEYMLKPTDPTSRIVNGRIYKLVEVESTDANGCKSTLTIEKEYMKSVPPDFFTPNGDGQNDGWDPDIYRSYPNLTVDIYDRYGRYITSLKSGEVWDGRYNGRDMPSGDYWYILRTHEDDDDKQYMGHFTLYR